jgi:hypothetical protein
MATCLWSSTGFADGSRSHAGGTGHKPGEDPESRPMGEVHLDLDLG